ncbi:hypothetical protein PsYK624_130680 [Phanerochaete sordida]|uniref:Uncharacterized protein n=1 Tax=Phanerochaete sordida TaxID=48140 RepID=A0A9P3GKW4_9APHY|nr:hypothetical protein PsYK624_130680 [Phanerochaete sordida]
MGPLGTVGEGWSRLALRNTYFRGLLKFNRAVSQSQEISGTEARRLRQLMRAAHRATCKLSPSALRSLTMCWKNLAKNGEEEERGHNLPPNVAQALPSLSNTASFSNGPSARTSLRYISVAQH